MSTIERLRRPSPVQYIDTCEDLIAHTTFYLKRLPKSDRFIWVTDLCTLVKNVGNECIKCNVIKMNYEQDFFKRREHLQNALGNLDTLEFYLGILCKNENYYSAMSDKCNNPDFPFIEWGRLLDTERNLILGVLKKDEERYQTLFLKNT